MLEDLRVPDVDLLPNTGRELEVLLRCGEVGTSMDGTLAGLSQVRVANTEKAIFSMRRPIGR